MNIDDLADGVLAERVAVYAEARDRQARAIADAAVAHVSDFGYCQGADEFGDTPYCDDVECTYCALARAMEGYK